MSKEKSLENKKMFDIIYRNTVRLLTMINRLMDFRKFENRKLTLKASENNLNQFIQNIYDSFKTLAESRKINFEVTSNLSVEKLWFDCDKMETVMYNLLSNAFKYTPENGEITISLTQENVEFPGLFSDEVCISVIDNGTGIPSADLSKIFERFYQNGQSKLAEGTGIGLNFSKNLVELHRGRITVKSTEGTGTIFSVFLPVGNLHLPEEEISKQSSYVPHILSEIPVVEVPEKTGKVSTKLNPVSENTPLILIVEDIQDVADFVKVCLGDDFKTVTALNGKEAIHKVMEQEPDLIISDVMMPEMDGFTLTKKLKSQVETSHIPIVLLTAKSTIEDKIEGIEDGADCFIEKPFNSMLLKTSVINLLNSRANLREHYRNSLDFNGKETEWNQIDKKFLEKLKKTVIQNIDKDDFNVDDLGHSLGISRVQLYRKVKKLTDMSVSEFVISVKLKRSLEYLRVSGKTITEIAYESGFSSQSYYTRCFKEQFKISPSDYMKKYRN
jgi:CheY-like chemotaxis protein